MQSVESQLTIPKNMSHPSSGFKSKLSKKPAFLAACLMLDLFFRLLSDAVGGEDMFL
jgi:hypothetical protein